MSSSQGPFVQCLSQLVSFSSLFLLTRYCFIPFPVSVFQQASLGSVVTYAVHTSPTSLHMHELLCKGTKHLSPFAGRCGDLAMTDWEGLCSLERELGSWKWWHVRRDLERQPAMSWEPGGPGSAQDPRCEHRLPVAIGKPSFPFTPFCSSHCSFESGFSCDSKTENIVP